MSREIPVTPNSFEQQFAHPQHKKIAGVLVDVFDLNPNEAKSPTPVLFGTGGGCTTEVYKPALETLVIEGRRVISLNHSRTGGDAIDAKSGPYPKEEFRKALNMIAVMDEMGITQADGVGHSSGAADLVIAAKLRPDLFRNLILYAPAGMVGKDTFFRFAKGYMGQFKGRPDSMKKIPISQTEKDIPIVALKEGLKMFLKNPARLVKEVLDVPNIQIYDLLEELHQQGIGIVIMSGVDDPVFPQEKMQELLKNDGAMIDGFVSLKGGHGTLGDIPHKFMKAVESILTKLEGKKK